MIWFIWGRCVCEGEFIFMLGFYDLVCFWFCKGRVLVVVSCGMVLIWVEIELVDVDGFVFFEFEM